MHILSAPSKDERRKIDSAKVATRKRFVAGDRSEPNTFEAGHQDEARLAAYVGYKDIASLRTFHLSPSFLNTTSSSIPTGAKGCELSAFFNKFATFGLLETSERPFRHLEMMSTDTDQRTLVTRRMASCQSKIRNKQIGALPRS